MVTVEVSLHRPIRRTPSRRVALAAIALLGALPGAARAQAAGVDAHGPVPPPVEGGSSSPLTLLGPQRTPAGAWSAGVLLELAEDTLVRFEQTSVDGPLTAIPLVGAFAALGLSGRYTLHERVSVGLTAPWFLRATGAAAEGGPTLGDVHLWMPVGIVLPKADAGVGVSAVPHLDLPTGPEARFLGDRAVRTGVTGVVGWRRGLLNGVVNLGLETGSRANLPNQDVGGPAARWGAAFGVVASQTVGVHVEGRMAAALGRPALGPPVEPAGRTDRPGEVLLTVAGRLPGDAWYVGGLGRAVTGGVGAARSRAFLGLGVASDADPDGVSVASDDDGGVTVRFVDPDGDPVEGVVLVSGGRELARSDVDGVSRLDGSRGRRGVEARAPGFLPLALEGLAEGSTPPTVRLAFAPRAVPLRVTDQAGRSVAPVLTARALDRDAPPLTVDGAALELIPGAWTLRIDADGFGGQEREIVIPERGGAVLPTEVVLLPPEGAATLVHRVVDVDGAPVAGARVLVDGQPVGTTGEGGALRLEGLPPGVHRLLVLHEAFTSSEEAQPFGLGDTVVSTILRRVPGSVRIVARGPDGRVVPDVSVRFDGPSRLAPMPLGERGERVTALSPGTWEVAVTSPDFGLQRREVVIPPDSDELVTIDVVLQPEEAGSAELVLRVIDPDGAPLDRVALFLDERPFGATSTGGALRLPSLLPGSRTLRMEGRGLRPLAPVDLVLVEGLQERVVALDWAPGTVHVVARTPEGQHPGAGATTRDTSYIAVDDAVVRFVGGANPQAGPLGPNGDAWFQLSAGAWEVVVASETYGIEARDLVVEEDSRRLVEVDVVMGRGEAGLATLGLRVVDPDGRPVGGAEVLLDGSSLGRTTNTGSVLLPSLSVGHRALEVRAPMGVAERRTVRLLEGRQEIEVELDWAPGATRVRVVDAGGAPVTDALVRMLGPASVPPGPVDPWGERVFRLAPGGWQALVVSPSHGIAEQPLDIGADVVGLTELTMTLGAVASGMADLVVRVVDSDGAPVPGARVRVDQQEVGTTGDGGVLLIQGLAPGPTRIGVAAEHFAEMPEARVTLGDGSQERVFPLAFLPGRVSVSVQDTAGQPVDATIDLVGPVDAPSFRTGPDGVERVALRPGRWQVIASTGTLGPARGTVTVEAGGDPAPLALVLAPSRVEVTSGAVVLKETVAFDFDRATLRPDGAPVLDEVANAILARSDVIRVEVQGHTDDVGSIPYNQDLSQRRAEAVLRALVERGVPAEMLVARGYGTQRPIDAGDTDAGRARNRRVAFEIVEQSVSD